MSPAARWGLAAVGLAAAWLAGQAARRRLATVELLVAGAAAETLLASAAALRRLGARITRYDADAGVLEARVGPPGPDAGLRVRAGEDGDATRLRLESDDAGARPVIRRFRAELTRRR